MWAVPGSAFTTHLFFESVEGFSSTSPATLWIDLGSMALGLIPMTSYRLPGNPYVDLFSREDRHAEIRELEQNLEGGADLPRMRR